jgi:rod shape-determining protein MreC
VPVYSVNRRRAIILLVLTSVLLLTLDIRGNAVVNRMRNVFSHALSPFVTAGDVIATPIKNVWHGATDYQDLRRENEALREQIAQQRGDQLAARAIVSTAQELLTLNGLIANYPRVTARVVGPVVSNFRQTVEIDRGSDDGILVGMAVINSAGLVGKITSVNSDSSFVLLVTDPEYTIECKVSGAPPIEEVLPDDTEPDPATDASVDTAGASTTTTTTTTTGIAPTDTTTVGTEPVVPTDPAAPDGTATDGTAIDGETTTAPPEPESTTTSIVERETGGCEGRGPDSLPVMKFVTEDPQYGSIGVGDIVSTAGGSKSLVPPDILIGTVVNKIERASSAGPLLEIQLNADLDRLLLVQIVRYRPTSEVPG